VRSVLLTADAVGGVWTFALDLACGLANRGVRVVLATLGPLPNESQRRAAAAIDGVVLVAREGRLEWMDDPWRDVDAMGEWLLALEEAERPDVVHHNGYAHAALPFRAPVLLGAHSCVTSWWRAVKHEDAPPSWDAYRARVRRGLAQADLVVAPTAAMMSALESCHGPVDRKCVIANGRRIAPFPIAKDPIVLTAGRLWDEAKNVAAVDDVARDLAWHTYVAGDTQHPSGERIELRAARSLGPLVSEALHAWMSRASIFALPARYEPFGLTALEAAQAGCALVLGDIPSLREVWGDAACFVPPDDRNALRAALRGLIANPVERARLQEAARTRALAFSPDAMTERYLAAYGELIARNARATNEESVRCAS
jgi:glycosyltransferase involved in cell wall biosynthesis